jgi:ribose transport system ATP-binding protein
MNPTHFSGDGLEEVREAPSVDMPALRVSGVCKAFGGTPALSDVDFDVCRGEVHALLGQNGSGKSTLVKILAGYHHPDAGDGAVYESELSLGNPDAAKALGIRFVHQDLGLVDTLSTVENLALGRGYDTRGGAFISWRAEAARARRAVEAIGYEFNVRLPVGRLAASERVAVAVARALQDYDVATSVLVLDEPTAAMPESEVRRFFGMVDRVRERGVAVIFISHRLEEVMMIAQRVTVLRDGRVIATHTIDELDDSRLIHLIVGEALEKGASTRAPHSESGTAVLTVSGLRGGGVRSADFQVGRGEILGIAGLNGSGRHDVAPLVFGGTSRDGGEVVVNGEQLPPGRPDVSVSRSVAFIPPDRKRSANLPSLTVRENLTLAGVGCNSGRIRLRRRKERADVLDWMKRFDVRPYRPEAPMWTLSGGNQQKVILARWIKLDPKLLILDEPTQGVDVGAKEQIYELVEQAAESGVAVLVTSSDSDELERLCDRVLVFQRGVVYTELAGPAVNKSAIDRAVLAVTAAEAV